MQRLFPLWKFNKFCSCIHSQAVSFHLLFYNLQSDKPISLPFTLTPFSSIKCFQGFAVPNGILKDCPDIIFPAVIPWDLLLLWRQKCPGACHLHQPIFYLHLPAEPCHFPEAIAVTYIGSPFKANPVGNNMNLLVLSIQVLD